MTAGIHFNTHIIDKVGVENRCWCEKTNQLRLKESFVTAMLFFREKERVEPQQT